MNDRLSSDMQSGALVYHSHPRPGKLEIRATKPLGNQRDLALAYSPGVAAPCLAIAADPGQRRRLHHPAESRRRHHQRHRRAGPRRHRPARGQAGDGGQGGPVQEIRRHRRVRHRNRRPMTSKSWSTPSPRWSRPSAASTSKTSRRPSVSRSNAACARRMSIPVFHDDQHGTAIIVGAAVRNGLELAGKKIVGTPRSSPPARARRRSPASTAGRARRPAREHLRHRSRGRGLQGPQQADGPAQGDLCAGDLRAHAGRRHSRRRRLPRPLRRRRAQARHGQGRWPRRR